MAVEWFCQVMGSEVGPLNQVQLVDMVRTHQLNPEDLVRRGNSPWVAAFEVKGLFEAAAKPPVPKPKLAEKPPSKPEPVKEAVGNAVASHGERNATKTNPTPAAEPSATDVSDWFCIASGQKMGPLGFTELKKLAADGSLREKDRVWRGSWPKFQQANEVDGLGFGG